MHTNPHKQGRLLPLCRRKRTPYALQARRRRHRRASLPRARLGSYVWCYVEPLSSLATESRLGFADHEEHASRTIQAFQGEDPAPRASLPGQLEAFFRGLVFVLSSPLKDKMLASVFVFGRGVKKVCRLSLVSLRLATLCSKLGLSCSSARVYL